MGQKRDYERVLFTAFLRVLPDFAGEPLEKWHQPEDEREFPDIIGTSPRGLKMVRVRA
jgi:hypothetical protein